jgi:galactokinase
MSHTPAQLHRKRFGTSSTAFQAPGRVNLIGEHTDTSEGFVMPAALDLRTVSTISPRSDAIANIYSANFDEQVALDLLNIDPHRIPLRHAHHWSSYPAAVLWAMHQRGIVFKGFDMTLAGDVPLGSGLSSSASVEVAVAIAVLTLAGIFLPKPEIAKICQSAENNYVGTQSGIMDPLASVCGVEDHALLLDCRSLEYEPLPLSSEVMLVICNTMVKHSLSDGGDYNRRRAEVQQGVRILQSHRSEIRTLRDVSEEELRAYTQEMPSDVFLRCLHVVTENARVLEAADALHRHDFARFGTLMYEAHISMRDNYAASCPEADTMVDLAASQPGCYGARITGGGFGGCTVNLVAADHAEKFVENVRAGYEKAIGIRAEIYLTRASNGAGPLVTES